MAETMVTGEARRVRVYINEGDLHGHEPLHVALVAYLRKEGAAGATVLRSVEGFGSSGAIHTTRLVEVLQRPALVLEWIDSPERVERLLPRLKGMVRHGFITVDSTSVVLSSPHAVRDVPQALTAGDVMSQDVVSVGPEAPTREVVERLVGKTYRGVPVVEGGRPVGIITNSDLLRRGGLAVRLDLLKKLDGASLAAELERVATSGKRAAEVMTKAPVTVGVRTPLGRVARLMSQERLKRLPVVDEHGALVGMVSRLDVLRTAVKTFEQRDEAPTTSPLAIHAPVTTAMRTDVPTVFDDSKLAEVVQAVISTRLNRCVVVDHNCHVLGKITDAEILERVTPALRPSALRSFMSRLPFVHPSPAEVRVEQHTTARTAAELMIEIAEVPEDAPLGEAIAIMMAKGHKLVAVVDSGGKLVGCLDRADLLHGLARQ